jgi:hypothetical protein
MYSMFACGNREHCRSTLGIDWRPLSQKRLAKRSTVFGIIRSILCMGVDTKGTSFLANTPDYKSGSILSRNLSSLLFSLSFWGALWYCFMVVLGGHFWLCLALSHFCWQKIARVCFGWPLSRIRYRYRTVPPGP